MRRKPEEDTEASEDFPHRPTKVCKVSTRESPLQGEGRPKRANRGQGGAIAQLQTISEQICKKGKRNKGNNVLKDVPVNTMAPASKGKTQTIQAKDDPPLHPVAPVPMLVNGGTSSVFGFKSNLPKNYEEVPDSDTEVTKNNDGDGSDIDMYVEDTTAKRNDDLPIDERSPDEDEEAALQVLRAPRRKSRRILSDDEEGDDDSYDVLKKHQERNRTILPPDPHSLHKGKHTSDATGLIPAQPLYGGGCQPSSSSPQSSSGSPQPSSGGPQSSSGGHQPSSGGPQPFTGGHQPSSGGHQPSSSHPQLSSGGRQPSSSHPQLSSGGRQPSFSTPQPSQPSFGSSQPSFGSSQPSFGGSQPSFSGPQPSQPSFSSSQPSFGGSRLSFGGSQPSFGGSQPSQPSFSGSQPSQLSSGGRQPSARVPQPSDSQLSPCAVSPRADDDPDDGNASDSGSNTDGQETRVRRRSKKPRASQLRFYTGCWVDVLKNAKNQYRLHIHTEDAFPERSPDNMSLVHDTLGEAIGKYQQETRIAALDEDTYKRHYHEMKTLIFEDGATYRGRLKTMGRLIVKNSYSDAISPRVTGNLNSEQYESIVRDNVTELLERSIFLRAPERDENNRTENFGHPAITELSKAFYYSGKRDCLSTLFQNEFKSFPKASLAMVATCIVNCLEEWQTGIYVKLPFTGDRYESVFNTLQALIEEIEEDAYHGRKLRRRLNLIAKEGLRQAPRRRGGNVRAFTVILD